MPNSITTIANMQVVPEKFTEYVVERTTKLNKFINSGIASGDPIVEKLINGAPEGGRFIEIPIYNPLEGEEDVFGEADVSIGNITTKQARVTLLMRQKAWGSTDLAHVLGGDDPLGAIAQQIADWRNTREQKIYLSILKGILDSANGALKGHVKDISDLTGSSALISRNATLDTKQLLGDHAGALGLVFMHSATETYLQKQELILRQPWVNPVNGESMEIKTFFGYSVIVDDDMPVEKVVIPAQYAKTSDEALVEGKDYYTKSGDTYTKVTNPDVSDIGDYYEMTAEASEKDKYTTYFLGSNAFIRQDGSPEGFVGTETDRDKIGAKNYLINRWCQVIHPRGLAWVSDGSNYADNNPYPSNADLANPANWSLVADHKTVAIAALVHTIGD